MVAGCGVGSQRHGANALTSLNAITRRHSGRFDNGLLRLSRALNVPRAVAVMDEQGAFRQGVGDR